MNLSVNLNNETSQVSGESERKPAIFLTTLLVVYLSSSVGKLIQKYYFNLEPVHLISINCLCDYLITVIMELLIRVVEYFGFFGSFCSVMYFLENLSNVIIFQSFCLMELDRFLALYWNLLYYERVTNQRAFNFIIMVKLGTFFMFWIYFWTYDLFFCSFPVCSFVEMRSFYPIVISQTFYIVITISVCVYVFEISRKHQNAVVPIFIVGQNQNQPEVESPQSNIAKLAKIGVKVNIISLIQLVPECPRVLASVFFHFHNYSCDDDTADNNAIKIVLLGSFISTMLVPILIYKKLDHYQV